MNILSQCHGEKLVHIFVTYRLKPPVHPKFAAIVLTGISKRGHISTPQAPCKI